MGTEKHPVWDTVCCCWGLLVGERMLGDGQTSPTSPGFNRAEKARV